MKHLKRILSLLLVVALFTGSFIGSFSLFNKGTYDYDIMNLSVFEDEENSYFLRKADPFIKFRIDASSNKSSAFSLCDGEGNPVKAKTERVLSNSFNILPPESGYVKGELYTLVLADNVRFHDEDLKKAKKLTFTIEREEVEKYKFSDNVTEVKNKITELGDDSIVLPDTSLQKDDIVLGQNADGEQVVHKIVEVLDDGTAKTVAPTLDEIYSVLDIYGTYHLDVAQIAKNPDLEAEIVDSLQESDFLNALTLTAQAEEKPSNGALSVKVEPDFKAGSLKLEIGITLKPGENGLFGIQQLKKQQVALTLTVDIQKITVDCDKNLNIFDSKPLYLDLSSTVTSSFSWKVDITPYETKPEGNLNKETELEDVFSKDNKFANIIDYHKHAKEIVKKLDKLAADVTGGEIKIPGAKVSLPIPTVPGVYFTAEIKLFTEFKLGADITIGQKTDSVVTSGVIFSNFSFTPYKNIHKENKDSQLSLKGKAGVEAGVKLEIAANIVNEKVACVKLNLKVGLYSDIFVTFPIATSSEISDDNFLYSYFEFGLFFSAEINPKINLFLKTYEKKLELAELKLPIIDLGKKEIALGLVINSETAKATDNAIETPVVLFEYFDVPSGTVKTKKLSHKDLKFVTNDGEKLSAKNGKLSLPAAASSDDLYVIVSYLKDDKTYSEMFKVLLSGSMLEGKVSAYSDDLSSSALSGANVKVYSTDKPSAPLFNTSTDESGKFSFNVSAGNYKLVISAEGYKTLTTFQAVNEDEIKYTEHILLIDGAESGNGTAGGRITDAINGKGIGNVKLKLRNEWNNTSGEYVEGFETYTSSSGQYSVSGLPVGYYTVEASLDGYVTGYSNIIIMSENSKSDFDFTITPILSDDDIRIVLTWGASPSDLDSHLIGKTPSGNNFNVYYQNKVYRYNSTEMANLDVDDTSSYGPETITILENIYETYIYAVHDYTNKNSSASNKLSMSGAVVKVYRGSTQLGEYHVPTDQIGTYWTVFAIDRSGNLLPINSLSNNKPEV